MPNQKVNTPKYIARTKIGQVSQSQEQQIEDIAKTVNPAFQRHCQDWVVVFMQKLEDQGLIERGQTAAARAKVRTLCSS